MDENQTIKERLIAFIAYLNIGQGKFEKNCGLANAYVANIRKSITPEKLQQIAQCYPELNTGWLMTGEGEMLRKAVSQHATGDNNTQVAGNGNNVNAVNIFTLDKALNEIAEQRKLVAKSQEQIDRLVSIIEKLTINK